ncbi:MAG: CidA/LrgA family protein [Agathobacter sp.]
MKYLKQFFIIVLFSFVGELLHCMIPISIPASIYGLVLLFVALLIGIIKLPQVKETAFFLIEIMPIMFVPAGVGLMESWGALQEMLIPVLVIMIVSTILVMGVAGQVTQLVIHRERKKTGGRKK